MVIYAVLNENNIVTGISQLTGAVEADGHIDITEHSDPMSLMWHKYEDNQFSEGTFEPETSAPITEFEEVKQKNMELEQQLHAVTGMVDELLIKVIKAEAPDLPDLPDLPGDMALPGVREPDIEGF